MPKQKFKASKTPDVKKPPIATNSPYTLDEHVPFLINRVAAIGVRAFSQELARAKISVPMWRVIAVLWSRGDQRQTDLSESTAIEKSTLSRLIGTLCRSKLVSRERSQSSTREVTVGLTERGKALAKQYIPLALEYERIELRGLSESEQTTLRHALRVIYSNIRPLAGD
jgi:DNA-binding MarR family transcriptional regulator